MPPGLSCAFQDRRPCLEVQRASICGLQRGIVLPDAAVSSHGHEPAKAKQPGHNWRSCVHITVLPCRLFGWRHGNVQRAIGHGPMGERYALAAILVQACQKASPSPRAKKLDLTSRFIQALGTASAAVVGRERRVLSAGPAASPKHRHKRGPNHRTRRLLPKRPRRRYSSMCNKSRISYLFLSRQRPKWLCWRRRSSS